MMVNAIMKRRAKLERLFIILIVLFTMDICVAQKLVDVFSQYYPDQFLKQPNFEKAENPKLQNFGKLNPGLIYYYIENLNKRLIEKNTHPDSNFTNILKASILRSRHLKRNWAHIQSNLVENEALLSVKKRAILRMLSEYDYEIVGLDTTDYSEFIDFNRRYFYHYLYFTNQKNIDYIPEKDYQELLQPVYREKIAAFEEAYDKLSHLSRKKREWWINEARKYAFLFKESYLNEYPVTTEFYFYEFIKKAISPDYKNYSSLGIQLQVDVLPHQFKETLDFEDPFGQTFEYRYKNEFQPIVFLNASFKLKTKPGLSSFSSFTLQVGYSLYQNYSNTVNQTTLWSGIRSKEGVYVSGSYNISDHKNFESYAINTKLFTPIYYYSKNLSLYIGMVYTFQHIAFEYDFFIDGTVYAAYSDAPPEFLQNRTVKVKNDKHLFYPLISIKYNVLPQLNLNFDYLLIQHFRLGLSYHLNL